MHTFGSFSESVIKTFVTMLEFVLNVTYAIQVYP